MNRATLLSALLFFICSSALTACDSTGDKSATGDTKSATKSANSHTEICGVIDRALLRRVIGDAGVEDTVDRTAPDPFRCSIRNTESDTTFMQIQIGTVDATEWKRTLRNEAAEATYGDCQTTFDGDPGVGYGCTYESGAFAAGAGVNVVKGDHLIRVTVYKWPKASAAERLRLAGDVARELETKSDKLGLP